MAWQYYRMFAGDFERDTGDLSLAEAGAYIRLMNHYYSTRKPLPKELNSLYRICGAVTVTEKAAVSKVIFRYFDAKPANFTHGRIEQELNYQDGVSALQSRRRRSTGASNGPTRDNPEADLPVPVPDIKQERSKALCARFVKPTFYEVDAYCTFRAKNVDPHSWYDHYESNGWKVGKNPMKDWKAAIRTWENNGVERRSNGYKSASAERVDRTKAALARAYERSSSNGAEHNNSERQDRVVGRDGVGLDQGIFGLLSGKVV